MVQLTKQQRSMLQTFQSHVSGRRYGDAISVGEELLTTDLPHSEPLYRVLNNLGIAYDCSGDEVNVYMEDGEVRFRSLDHLRRAVEVAQYIGRGDLAERTSQLIDGLPNSYFEGIFELMG